MSGRVRKKRRTLRTRRAEKKTRMSIKQSVAALIALMVDLACHD